MPKVKYGLMLCLDGDCESHEYGAKVVVFRNQDPDKRGNPKDVLSYRCDYCKLRPYVHKDTEPGSFDNWMRRTTPFEKPKEEEKDPHPIQGVETAEPKAKEKPTWMP
jgi:hypothetical protein